MKFILVSICIIFSGLLFSQDISKHYKIYDTKKKKEVSLNEIVDAMHHADILFFGEFHNDSIAHILQKSVYQELITKYIKVALSLEQLPDDKQEVLNDYLSNTIDEKKYEYLADVWMPIHHSYQPLINIAKQNNLPVIAANVPNQFIELVRTKGKNVLDSLDEKSKLLLPSLPYYINGEIYRNKYFQDAAYEVKNDSTYEALCLYDATMAYNSYKFLQNHSAYKIFQILGNFHVEKNLGTIEQFRHLSSEKFITISCFYNDDFKHPQWNQYQQFSDFVIVTDPAVKRTF